MSENHPTEISDAESDQEVGLTFSQVFSTLRAHLLLLTFGPLIAGCMAFGVVTYFVTPTFTARTTFILPQQGQANAASAMSSLGALAGLTGGAVGVRNSGDQYIALMQSVTVSDRIIDHFNLMETWGLKLRVDARSGLAGNVRISLGKKDGLVAVEVDDNSPQRAANIANRYVDELRRLTSTLAVSEAQQRRVFFEQLLKQSRDNLVQAQKVLQSSGFNAKDLKAEPKAAAENFAKLKAETTAAEVKLQTLRGTLTDNAPEVQQQSATLAALRGHLARVEQAGEGSGGPDYVGNYREFKYQEALFEVYARQFELARVDESREGALIQVVDPATPPERKSKPRRGSITINATLGMAALLLLWVLVRQSIRRRTARP